MVSLLFFSSPILDSKVRCLALLKSGSVGSVEQRSTGPLLSAAKARQAKNVLAQFFICRAQEQREALLRDVRLRNRACSITAGADFSPHPSRAWMKLHWMKCVFASHCTHVNWKCAVSHHTHLPHTLRSVENIQKMIQKHKIFCIKLFFFDICV